MKDRSATTVRVAGYAVGGVLAVVAVLIMLIQIQVSDDEIGVDGSCGSALDVAVGRTGWQDWWNQDLSDPELAGSDQLLRTEECPDAVNRFQFLAGAFAVAAVLAGAVGELLRSRLEQPDSSSDSGLTLQRLGWVVAATGVVLLAAGLLGIILLVSDPDDTLFLFVSRPTVALIGLVLLLPAVVLVITGLVLRITGKKVDDPDRAAT